jgi:hypothetical protein
VDRPSEAKVDFSLADQAIGSVLATAFSWPILKAEMMLELFAIDAKQCEGYISSR